jgi:hypothetical protein
MKNKNSAAILQATAVFLIVAGAWGVIRLIASFSFYLYSAEVAYMVIPAAFFAFTIYSGYRLLKKEENGLKLARTVFALQMISFSLNGIYYFFCTGAFLILHLGTTGTQLNFDITTSMAIYWGTSYGGVSVGFNLLAIAAFVFLGKINYDRTNNEEKPEDLFPTVKPPTAHRPRETRL